MSDLIIDEIQAGNGLEDYFAPVSCTFCGFPGDSTTCKSCDIKMDNN